MARLTPPLVRLALALVPERWRASVERDLHEEGARRGWNAWTMAWHAVRIAVVLRSGRLIGRAASAGELSRTPVTGGKVAMETLAFDIRVAFRGLASRRATTAMIAMTLALGIGASTAAHAVFNFVLFRPVPGVSDERSLVSIYFQAEDATMSRAAASHAHLIAMREQVDGLTGLAAWRTTEFPFDSRPHGGLTFRPVTLVTRGFFDVIGVARLAGRVFSDEEYEDRDSRVAVISERLWRLEFGGDPEALGRTVLISRQPFQIVGVVDGFRGLDRFGRGGPEDVWIPYAARGAVGRLVRDDGSHEHLQMVGRRRAGATPAQVQAQAAHAFASAGEIPDLPERYRPAVFEGLTDGEGKTRARLLQLYWILMSGGGLLFLLACGNAANLMIARDVRRAPALALMTAIGATRWRLIRQLLLESLLLSGGAGLLGLGLAHALVGVFRGVRILPSLPVLDDLALDWRVVLFAALLAAATVVVAALLPAIVASRADPAQALKQIGRGATRTGRLRTTLVVAQIAVALTLLSGAGLLARTVSRLHALDPGVDTDVVTFTLSPTRLGYGDERTGRILADALARLRAAPGVGHAGVSYFPPFTMSLGQVIRLPEDPESVTRRGVQMYVSTGYFEALGIPVLAGRAFASAEADPGSTPRNVVVLSASLAGQLFGAAAAVGRHIVLPSRGGTEALRIGQTLGAGAGSLHEVIGVVGDTRGADLRAGFQPVLYRPFGRQRLAAFQVRSELPRGEAIRQIRESVGAVDSALPVSDVATVGGRIERLTTEERVLAQLAGLIAAIAVLLGATGVYALIAFFVSERTREFGIRLAMGAPRHAIAAAVLRRMFWMSGAGILAGYAMAVVGGRLLAARLYGVSPLDPVSFAGAGTLLLVIALLAAWLPARRASEIDPVVALRAE